MGSEEGSSFSSLYPSTGRCCGWISGLIQGEFDLRRGENIQEAVHDGYIHSLYQFT